MMSDSTEVSIETFDIRETGPYTGRRIAGTSGDVVSAVLTKEYSFVDGITILVTEIPARLDRTSGRLYISAHDGKTLMDAVRRYTEMLRTERSHQSAPMRQAHYRLHIHAPELLAA